MTTLTKEDAYNMGAKGSPHNDYERQLFEEYLRGHCWHCGEWLADKGYYEDMLTRMLFGVWRDRAALAEQERTTDAK